MTYFVYFHSSIISKVNLYIDHADANHYLYKINRTLERIDIRDCEKVDDIGSDIFTISDSGTSKYMISMYGINDDTIKLIINNVFTNSNKLSLIQKFKILRTCARVSQSEDDKIAYYPSDSDRARNRLVKIRPGRFLKKLFKDELSDEIIESLTNEWLGEYTGYEFKILTKSSDIENAYINGPRSCMSGEAETYLSNPYHPCEVYGTSDEENEYDKGIQTGLAVLLDVHGTVKARTLVHKDKKIYATLYGDYKKMEVRLAREGYTRSNDFKGARMRLLYNNKDQIVCPYLDVQGSVSIENDYLVIGGSEYEACYTNGTTDPCVVCACCNGHIDDDEVYYHNGEEICERCLNENTFYDYVIGVTCDNDENCIDEINGPLRYNGFRITNISSYGIQQLYEQGVLFQCDYNGEWYVSDSYESVEIEGSHGDTKIYEKETFIDKIGFYCSYTCEYYSSYDDNAICVKNDNDDSVYVSEESTSEIISDLDSKYAHDYINWLEKHNYVDPRIDDFVKNQIEMELVVN